MKFDAMNLEELEIALYDAFPDESSFDRMLTHGFGSSIATRLSNMKYAERVLAALAWAGTRDRHDQMVRIARRANPDNSKLRAFEKKIGTSVRTEDLKVLEKLLVNEALELQHVLDVGRSFDDVLWSPLVEPEDVRTAFRRVVDRLASMPTQPDGDLLDHFRRHPSLEAGLITEKGRNDSALLGIATRWDMLREEPSPI